MRSTFFGIEIGRTGITVAQLGQDVTGHNIANVDTKGFTRQRIVATAYDPFSTIGRLLPVNQARVGGGVRVMIHDQIRSAYLDRRYRTENTINSYWQKRTEGLRYLESFFDNVNEETSINYSIARFFQAIKVLAEDTVEGAPRKQLQTAGMDLAQQLNSIYNGLVDLQESQNLTVQVTVEEINRIAADIVELNKAIYGFEVTGHEALDLRDKRNLLLDELSTIVEIKYREEPDRYGGTVLIVETGGKELVNHDKRNELGVTAVDNSIAGEAQVLVPYWGQDTASFGAFQLEFKGVPLTNDAAREAVSRINRLAVLLDTLNTDIENAATKAGISNPPGPGHLDLDGLKKALSDAQEAWKTAQNDLNTAQKALSALDKDVKAAEAARDSKQEALDAADTALTNANNVLTEAEDDLAADPTNLELQEAVEDAKQAVEDAKQAVKDAEEALDDAEEALSDAKKDYDDLDATILGLESDLDDAAETRDGAQKALNDQLNLDDLIDQRKRQVQGLRNRVDGVISSGDLDGTGPVTVTIKGEELTPTSRASLDPDPLMTDLIVTGGELKAYLDMRDNITVDLPGIPYYIEMVNNLARALVQEINRVHREGYTDPPGGGSENGVDFFGAKDANGNYIDHTNILNVTAKNICLSEAVQASEYNIASSSKEIIKNGEPEQLQRGNNENMNKLYALFLLKDISLVTGADVAIGSFDGYATSIRFDIGNTLSFAKKTADTSAVLTLAADNQRISIAGVSLDEEMTNMIKYQHAYSGAARVITVMDEMLDRLINGTGRVGL